MFLATILAIQVLTTAVAGAPEGEKPLPHGILLLTLDTTRADRLGAYGSDAGLTPNLDELARGGVRFERAISPMPTTDPSHLSMLTGLHPRTHGSRRNGIPLSDPSRPNLARWMREHGFRTSAFVSRRHLVPSELGLEGFEVEDGPKNRSRDGAITIDRALAFSELRQGTRRKVTEFAVQDRRYKLILTRPGDHVQLYDTARDVGESVNLADALPEVRDRLLAGLQAWLKATPVAGTASAAVPEEKQEALRALGYIE